MMEEKKIRELIGRFLEGETTNAEERLLYDYFAGSEVAPALEPWRPMFGWYAGGCREEELPSAGQGRLGHRRGFRRIRLLAVGVAAALLLLFGVGLGYYHHLGRQREYAVYEGSYIVRNGKKLTDIREILPELKAVEREVSDRLRGQDENQVIPTI